PNLTARSNICNHTRTERRAVKNDSLRTFVLLIQDERDRRIAVRVKTCLVFGFTGTRAVAAIVDEQNVESSFRQPLAQPTHVRNVAAVAVKENDSRSAGLFRTLEIPAVQPVSSSSRKPRIRCSRR